VSKTILVSGASGLIGRALCQALANAGHHVRTLSRGEGDVCWDPSAGRLDPSAMAGVDAVIHLAGEPIAQRWTPAARERILRSRIDGTSLLAREALKQPVPPAFICASGINAYGYDVDDPVDETCPAGDGFLAQVCREWEAACDPLVAAGVRTVLMRTGIVLSADGGALAKMLLPFKCGVGGRIGSGRQLMSWISLADLAAAYLLAVEDSELRGPVNAVAPEPVTNATFTDILGKVLRRPTILPLPAAAVRLVFGQMGIETVLANIGVVPTCLKRRGFTWQTPELDQALRACLAQTGKGN